MRANGLGEKCAALADPAPVRPDRGEISFHGISLRELHLDEWRTRLAVVSQTPFLFSDSVAMNIALGKPDATQEDIERVAKLASVHEDILRLPEGYQTEVGERGVMLVGGTKTAHLYCACSVA